MEKLAPVAKNDGSLRLTVDFQPSITVAYKEPRHTSSPFNLAVSIPAGMTKTVLDALNGYQSLPLAEESRDATQSHSVSEDTTTTSKSACSLLLNHSIREQCTDDEETRADEQDTGNKMIVATALMSLAEGARAVTIEEVKFASKDKDLNHLARFMLNGYPQRKNELLELLGEDCVFVQSQDCNHPNRWDRTRQIAETNCIPKE